jgi:hypothetical protein
MGEYRDSFDGRNYKLMLNQEGNFFLRNENGGFYRMLGKTPPVNFDSTYSFSV